MTDLQRPSDFGELSRAATAKVAGLVPAAAGDGKSSLQDSTDEHNGERRTIEGRSNDRKEIGGMVELQVPSATAKVAGLVPAAAGDGKSSLQDSTDEHNDATGGQLRHGRTMEKKSVASWNCKDLRRRPKWPGWFLLPQEPGNRPCRTRPMSTTA
jgi:hypothetical protein